MVNVIELLEKKAKEKKNMIIVGEAWDERALKAAEKSVRRGICECILLGDVDEITALKEKLNLEFDAKIICPWKDEMRHELAKDLFELRKHKKGMSLDIAEKMIEDVNVFGSMLVFKGIGDGFCSSCQCSTAEMMRPVLQIIKTKHGIKTVSEIFCMVDKLHDDRLIFMTDASIVIDPTPEQRADIVFNSVEIVSGLGLEPRVAVLSHSTLGSGEHPVLEPLRETLKICREKDPSLVIDGEMQADAALNPFSAEKKSSDLIVKGDANILVFPELMSANIAGHLLMQLTDNTFYSFLGGTKHPAGIFGRGAPSEHMETVITTVAAQCNM